MHDQGKYEEAIEKYNDALKIDENSAIANYELSYTYLAINDFQAAILYSTRAIQSDPAHAQEAYVVYGSALDMSGDPLRAIEIFEEGLQKFPNHVSLNYNLALTALRQNKLKKAEKAALNALRENPYHPGSHIVLSGIADARGEKIKALLPLYFFLVLENNSPRSQQIYNLLRTKIYQGFVEDSEESVETPLEITLPYSTTDSDLNMAFGVAEIMLISILGTLKKETRAFEEIDEYTLFAEITRTLFDILAGLKKDNEGLWCELYVTTFEHLVQSDNWEAYSYFISMSAQAPEVHEWVANNRPKVQSLETWLIEKGIVK